MGIIRKPITESEIEVANIALRQPMGQTETVCEHIRAIFNMAGAFKDEKAKQDILNECLTVIVYTRRMDAKLQAFHQHDYEI